MGEKWRGRGESRLILGGEYGRGGRLKLGGVKGREGCVYWAPPGPEMRGDERRRG